MQARHLAVVAVEEGEQIAGQVVLVAIGELADDGAIECDVARALGVGHIHEDVAGMHVGVKEVVDEHLVEEGLHPAPGQDFEIDALRIEPVEVAHGHAVDALQHQHVGAGELVVDLGDVEQFRGGEVLAQPLGVGRLLRHVELLEHRIRVLPDHFREVQALAGGDVAVDPAGELGQQGQDRREWSPRCRGAPP